MTVYPSYHAPQCLYLVLVVIIQNFVVSRLCQTVNSILSHFPPTCVLHLHLISYAGEHPSHGQRLDALFSHFVVQYVLFSLDVLPLKMVLVGPLLPMFLHLPPNSSNMLSELSMLLLPSSLVFLSGIFFLS